MRFSFCEKYDTTITELERTSQTSQVSYEESTKNSSIQED
jgi:hypothetical protein